MHKRTKWAIKAREPTFNLNEREWAIKVLAKVEVLLSKEPNDGKIRMICPAIDKAAKKVDRQGATDVVVKLQELIRLRLRGHSSLRSWLAKQGVREVYSDEPDVYRKVQTTRHEWVANLVKEISNEQSASGKPVSHKKRAPRKADRAARTVSSYVYDEPGIFDRE